MSSIEQARQTQIDNIQKKTGKTLDELRVLVADSGLTRHSEIRQMLIDTLGLGYGDANTLVHLALASDGQSAAEASAASMEDILAGIYTASKAPLLPIHIAFMEAIQDLGEFEIAPKKTYLSLRRKKQFAMVGPASKGRVEVGLNVRDLPDNERLQAQAPGGMCQYKVYLTAPEEVDAELLGWIRTAFEGAG
ncbi:MAG: DUF4287 domain-containing protein [Anaerolineae bacterium]|nr:DUF4287 domain-containing protein [Anaerolineae bacterium]